MKITTKK